MFIRSQCLICAILIPAVIGGYQTPYTMIVVSIPDGGTFSFSCGFDTGGIIRIVSVLWGRNDVYTNGVAYCGDDQTAGCHLGNITDAVIASCGGQHSSCSFPITVTPSFPDPCPGAPKTATAVYYCSACL